MATMVLKSLGQEGTFSDEAGSVVSADRPHSDEEGAEKEEEGVDPKSDEIETNSGTACGSLIPSLRSLFRRVARSLHRDDAARIRTASFSSLGCSTSDGECMSPMSGQRSRPGSQKESKVKNIYRQPLSRTSSRLRAYSCSRCQPPAQSADRDRRRHASCSLNVDAGDSSEDGSDISDVQDHEPRRRTIDTVPRSSDAGRTEDFADVSCRRRSSSMPPLLQSILKRRCATSAKRLTKQASFHDKVDVCYFDWETERKQDGGQPSEETTGARDGGLGQDNDQLKARSSVSKLPQWASRDDQTICNVEGRIVLSIDSQGNKGRRLLLTIETKGKFDRNKTSVKCVSSGTALKVYLQPEDSGDKPAAPVVKNLPLPVTIDPFNVKASLQRDGVFVLLAPVMQM